MRRYTQSEAHTLALEAGVLRREVARLREPVADLDVPGCGDNSCVVAKPQGMATNGGCRCDERTLRRALQHAKARIVALSAELLDVKQRYDIP